MKKTTREWVGKAEDDYRTAELLAQSSEPLHDQLCFHCQQAAEKNLKALLEELGLSVEKTHELEDLLDRLRARHPSLPRYAAACHSSATSRSESAIPATMPPSVKPKPPYVGPARCATPAAGCLACVRRAVVVSVPDRSCPSAPAGHEMRRRRPGLGRTVFTRSSHEQAKIKDMGP
jgi:HEPN domain-containing protein